MKYALRNIVRLKVRSLLLFAVAFTILFLSMFGLLVGELCRDSRERFYGPLDGSFAVTDESGAPFLSYEAATYMAEYSDVIEKTYAVKRYVGFLLDGRDYTPISYIGKGEYFRRRVSGDPNTPNQMVEYSKGFSIVGVSEMSILEEVHGGNLEMVAGTPISEGNNARHDNKIVISKSIAEQEGLSVGDTVSLYMKSVFFEDRDGAIEGEENIREYFTYIVGGIFDGKDLSGIASAPFSDPANAVYVPISTLVDMTNLPDIRTSFEVPELLPGLRRAGAIDNPTLVPDTLCFRIKAGQGEALADAINSLGMVKNVKLTERISDAASSPSVRLSQMVSVLLIGIVAAGFAVFLMVVFFNMNARSRELAVLSALGKRRSGVALTFFAEILVLSIGAFLLGGAVFTLATRLFAVPITEYLNGAEFRSMVRSETATHLISGQGGTEKATKVLADFASLFENYLFPTLLAALAGLLLFLAVTFLFVYRYCKRMDVLLSVGGKE